MTRCRLATQSKALQRTGCSCVKTVSRRGVEGHTLSWSARQATWSHKRATRQAAYISLHVALLDDADEANMNNRARFASQCRLKPVPYGMRPQVAPLWPLMAVRTFRWIRKAPHASRAGAACWAGCVVAGAVRAVTLWVHCTRRSAQSQGHQVPLTDFNVVMNRSLRTPPGDSVEAVGSCMRA